MQNLLKSKYLPLVAPVLGLVGFGLRKGLYVTAVDTKNLLQAGHPLEIALWAVVVLAAVVAVIAGRQQPATGKSVPAVSFAGSILLAAGILATVLGSFGLYGLALARSILGILAALSLVAAAVQQLQKKPVFFLLYGVVCIFLAVHMVSCYQGWSSNPQIQDYVFTLLACVGLMLFAYQKTACAVSCGSMGLMRFIGTMTVFCCFTALSGTECLLLCLAGGIWVIAGLLGE